MNKVLCFVFAMAFGSQTMAGYNGGYSSRSCISASGRTVFTDASDWDNPQSGAMRLIIDGAEATYDFADASVEMAGDDGRLSVLKNGVEEIFVNYNAQNQTVVVTVNVDPRKDSWASENVRTESFDVHMTCKYYDYANPI